MYLSLCSLFHYLDSNLMPMSSVVPLRAFCAHSLLFRRTRVYSCPLIRCFVSFICSLRDRGFFLNANFLSGICYLRVTLNELRSAHRWRRLMEKALQMKERIGCPMRRKLNPFQVGAQTRLLLQANLRRRLICLLCLALWSLV